MFCFWYKLTNTVLYGSITTQSILLIHTCPTWLVCVYTSFLYNMYSHETMYTNQYGMRVYAYSLLVYHTCTYTQLYNNNNNNNIYLKSNIQKSSIDYK